jgi:hypothetical protein
LRLTSGRIDSFGIPLTRCRARSPKRVACSTTIAFHSAHFYN